MTTLGAIPPNQKDILKRGGRYMKKSKGLLGNSEQALGHYRSDSEIQSGTSIFDPVLCELVYRWFCPAGGAVLDPFAGGSVRGIVASVLGYNYQGIDLSGHQVAANQEQAKAICGNNLPAWHVGDARKVKNLCKFAFDLVFSCPPYYDLEVYSDDPGDLSRAQTYDQFIEAYRQIIRDCISLLKPNRFACFVVGDIRDKRGFYRNFVSDTITAFEDAGATLYNEAILVTAVGSLPIRCGRQFESGRKLGKTHQNVLVFFKGDPKEIATWPLPEFGETDLAPSPTSNGIHDLEQN